MEENEDAHSYGPLDDDAPYTRVMAEEYVANTYERVASSMFKVREAVRAHNLAEGRPAYAPLIFKVI